MLLLRGVIHNGNFNQLKDLAALAVFYLKSMKPNTVSNKLALVSVAVCVLMLAFSHNAGAAPHAVPPNTVSVSVPDGGATIMLLGAALGALGMARRFLKS
jgi:VPDSG-CTERM motif